MQSLTMQRHIQTLAFLILGDTQANRQINQLETKPCAKRAPNNGDKNADTLNPELRGIAFYEARNPLRQIRIG